VRRVEDQVPEGSFGRPEEGLRQGAQARVISAGPPASRPAHDHDAGQRPAVRKTKTPPLSPSFIVEVSLSREALRSYGPADVIKECGHARWQRRFEEDQGRADLG